MLSAHSDDRALVRRLLGGDEEAFAFFFETYFTKLYRFALARLSRDGDAAEDVVQQTLSRAVRKLDTYRGEAALFTWLCTFCRHELSAHYGRRQRTSGELPLVEDHADVRAALESLRAAYDGPHEQLVRNELARRVQVVLDALPDHYGDALEWKYILGMSVQEIAVRLDVGPKAAESLLTRARQAFRDAFVALGDGAEVWEP